MNQISSYRHSIHSSSGKQHAGTGLPEIRLDGGKPYFMRNFVAIERIFLKVLAIQKANQSISTEAELANSGNSCP